MDATDPEIALRNFTNSVSRSIRAVIVNNDDLVVVPFQGGLNGEHQSVDVFDLVEGRHHNGEFESPFSQFGIIIRREPP